jgi:hypothetical protein
MKALTILTASAITIQCSGAALASDSKANTESPPGMVSDAAAISAGIGIGLMVSGMLLDQAVHAETKKASSPDSHSHAFEIDSDPFLIGGGIFIGVAALIQARSSLRYMSHHLQNSSLVTSSDEEGKHRVLPFIATTSGHGPSWGVRIVF